MTSLLRLAGAAALSIALGLFSAYQAVCSGFAGGDISNGPWRTSSSRARATQTCTRARAWP
jgi:hypothetical protein